MRESLRGRPGSFYEIADRINSAKTSRQDAIIAAESATGANGLRLVRMPMPDGNVVISSVLPGVGKPVLVVDLNGKVAYASATIEVSMTVNPQNPLIIKDVEPKIKK